jgi:hypothetical protein
MARLIQKPKEEYLQHLRVEINKKFVRTISSANDCETLALDIFLKTQHRLSNDTIRRLFTIKRSISLPSIYTLDVCAQYLEFNNWEAFVQTFLEQSVLYQRALLFDVIAESISFEDLLNRINSDIKSTDLFQNFNKIMLYKAQIKDEQFFRRLFEFTNIFELQELYKYDVYYTIHLLGSLCDRYDWLSIIAIEQYHTVPYEENYFVEWLVVPEKSYYLFLLENYYHANSTTKAAAIFYHLLRCTHFAEKKQWEVLDAHFKMLLPLLVGSYTLNSILKTRWLGVQLYHDSHFFEGTQRETIWKRILNSPQVNEKDTGDRITCVFIISQYLHQLEEFEFVITLYEQKVIESETLLGHWGGLNFNQLKVLYAAALLHTNRRTEAKVVFESIKPNQFDLNFKTSMLNIYNVLVKELN